LLTSIDIYGQLYKSVKQRTVPRNVEVLRSSKLE